MGIRAGEEEKLVHCRVCASHSQQALGRDPPAPPVTLVVVADRVGLSGRGRNRFQSHSSTSCSIHSGHQEGIKGGHHTHLPWARVGNGAYLGRGSGVVAAPKLGGGVARQETGIDWCPVDSLSSAPSPSQAL